MNLSTTENVEFPTQWEFKEISANMVVIAGGIVLRV
jgi:hypothetical protein